MPSEGSQTTAGPESAAGEAASPEAREALLALARRLAACRREHSDGVFTDEAEPIFVKAQHGTR